MRLYANTQRKNGRTYRYPGVKPPRPKRPSPDRAWADFSYVAGIPAAADKFRVTEYDIVRARKLHGKPLQPSP